MKARDLLFLFGIIAAVYLVVTYGDDIGLRWRELVEPEPTPRPRTVCDKFQFETMLAAGYSFLNDTAVDTNHDGIDECVVLVERTSQTSPPWRRPVFGVVYHVDVKDGQNTGSTSVPVEGMRRYQLTTREGLLVRLGLMGDGDPYPEVRVINADARGKPELIFLDHNRNQELVGLTVFRWRPDLNKYYLIGYMHGDWLETEPDPIGGYIEEVSVCDRQYPADASEPDRVWEVNYVWKGDEFGPGPERGRCVER